MAYIDFLTYQEFGGRLDESSFNLFIIDLENRVNSLTFGKYDKLINSFTSQILPDDIKQFETISLNTLYEDNEGKLLAGLENIGLSSYSNGIESLGYKATRTALKDMQDKLRFMMKTYLWKYYDLFYRGRAE